MDSDNPQTCGQGIAANGDLPEALVRVLRGVANVLDNHIRSLDRNDAGGRIEADAYRLLVAEHRGISVRLETLAALMRGYCDLPMATHDMNALMDQASFEVFADLVACEKALLVIVQARVTEHEAILAGSAGE